MRKLMISLALAGAIASTTAVAALADSSNHSQPGTPGDANCVGQTMAFLAQGGAVDVNGIGNVSKATGLTVQQIHDIVETFCA